MHTNNTTRNIAIVANMLGLTGIIVLLLMTFILQFSLHELPCPLCLLQRVGFVIAGIGLLFNLRFGLRTSHYMWVILGTLFSAYVSLRQVTLHVVPGTGVYGSSILGMHLYTWAFVIAMVTLLLTAILAAFDKQYLSPVWEPSGKMRYLVNFLFALMFLLTFGNLLGVLAECGIHICPANPTSYF